MVYHSKKDWWLVSLVWAAVLVPLLVGLYALLAPGAAPRAGWSPILVGTSTGAVVLWLTYPLYYEITPSELKVRCGALIRQRIPLRSIEEVTPTRDALSAPAWSLDRLRVSFRRDGGEGCVLISPDDKAGFMRELAASGAGLELRGGRVVRAA